MIYTITVSVLFHPSKKENLKETQHREIPSLS